MSFRIQIKLINSDKSAHKIDVEVNMPEAESSSTMRGVNVTPGATAEVAFKIPAENISTVDIVLKHTYDRAGGEDTGIARLEAPVEAENFSKEEEQSPGRGPGRGPARGRKF